MSIHTACPGCQARLELAEEFAGKNVVCNDCGRMFIVPAASDAAPPAPASAPEPIVVASIKAGPVAPTRKPAAPSSRRADSSVRRPRESSQGAMVMVVAAVAVAGVLVLGLGAVLALFLGGLAFWFEAAPAPPVEAPPPVADARKEPRRDAMVMKEEVGDINIAVENLKPFQEKEIDFIKEKPALVDVERLFPKQGIPNDPPAKPPVEVVVPKIDPVPHHNLAVVSSLKDTWDDPIYDAAFSADSKKLLVARKTGLAVYALPDMELKGTIKSKETLVRLALDTKNGRLFAVGCKPGDAGGPLAPQKPGQLRGYKLGTLLDDPGKAGPLEADMTLEGLSQFSFLQLSADGQSLYGLNFHDRKAVRYSAKTGKTEASTDVPPNTISMTLTYDGKSLYAAAYSKAPSAYDFGPYAGKVMRLDPATMQITKTVEVPVNAIGIAATDRGIIVIPNSSGQHTFVGMVDMNKGAFAGKQDGIYHGINIALHPDQQKFIAVQGNLSPSSIDSYFIPPNPTEGRLQQCAGAQGAGGQPIFSPDGRFVFTTGGQLASVGR